MEVELFVPKGSEHYLSAEWRELMQHAMREATLLEITLDMNNGGGWAGAGGSLDHSGTIHARSCMERDSGRRSEEREHLHRRFGIRIYLRASPFTTECAV